MGSEGEVEGRKLRTTSIGRVLEEEEGGVAVLEKSLSLEKLIRLTGLESRFFALVDSDPPPSTGEDVWSDNPKALLLFSLLPPPGILRESFAFPFLHLAAIVRASSKTFPIP